MVRNMFGRMPEKPKVLLLGISYPSVADQMEKHGFGPDILDSKEPCVDQAVECVRRGILTEMDARDLARCVATEQSCDVDAYTVSKEIGAVYRDDRHVHGNFNARNFCNSLKNAFGSDIQFSQVILDYYWMPTGWLVTRWAKTLFQQTLPDLVRYNMLTYPSHRKSRRKKEDSFDEGVVYLPFCAHVCKELVAAIDILKNYYAITFVKKSELAGHSLWKGTMTIGADVMQHRLGKRLDQEEVYCTFRPKDIYESMEDAHVKKDSVMEVLQAIEDYDNIRMIRLRPLRQHEPPSIMKERLLKPEVGGFLGLNYNLAKERKRQAELEAQQKRLEEKREKERAIKEKEMEKERKRLEIKKERERQREIKRKKMKKEKEKRQQEMKKVALLKKEVENKKRKRSRLGLDLLYSDVEEIPLYDSKSDVVSLFFPGPAPDLSAYGKPESYKGRKKKPVIKKRPVKKKKKTVDRTFLVPTPSEYLAFNPRVKVDKEVTGTTTRLSRNVDLAIIEENEWVEEIKNMPHQRLVPDVHEPNDSLVEGACDLICMKDRGIGDFSFEVEERKKLSTSAHSHSVQLFVFFFIFTNFWHFSMSRNSK